MAVIPVNIANRPYEVRVQSGLITRIAQECGGLLRKARVPIITDSNVHARYASAVEDSFSAMGKQVVWRVLPAGEQTKSWEVLAETADWLLAEEVERNDHIVALGGGVIGDLTGFAAAILKRGCNFIQVPTTLLAQVDSSVGGKTAIIGEDGKAEWEYAGSSRDGFVLPNGNILIAWADRVEEVTREKQIVFFYKRSKENGELSTAQRLYNGNTLVTELGPRPRLLEVNPQGNIVLDVPLQPETENVHMQTRMARQLRNGNFLVPHLLAFAVKEYSPEGRVVHILKTDLDELGGRRAENWPFTAIRLDNGNTLVSLTHGNKVVEFGPRGEVVWKVDNSHVDGQFKDPCGSQRLASGNTVVGSHAASKGVSMIEVTPERKIVWTSDHPLAAGVHHFQILTTNGKPEPGMPLK